MPKVSATISSLAEDTGGQKEDNYIRAACFSPDGKSIATGSEDRTIRIWDIASRKVRHAFHGHRSEIYSLAFSPDGRFLMSGSGDRTARIWDMDTGAERFNLAIEDTVVEGSSIDAGVTSVAVSPDGKLLAAGSLDTIVRLWDASTGKLLDRLRGHRDSVYSVAFSPDGAWLVSGSLDKTLKIWDLQPVKTALSNGTYAAGITASSSAADGNADVKTEDPSAKDVDKEQSAKIISTLSGHKVNILILQTRSIFLIGRGRTTFYLSQCLQTAIGSYRDQKTVVCHSGIQKPSPLRSFCKVTRTLVCLA